MCRFRFVALTIPASPSPIRGYLPTVSDVGQVAYDFTVRVLRTSRFGGLHALAMLAEAVSRHYRLHLLAWQAKMLK
jgi:hypothetical protein